MAVEQLGISPSVKKVPAEAAAVFPVGAGTVHVGPCACLQAHWPKLDPAAVAEPEHEAGGTTAAADREDLEVEARRRRWRWTGHSDEDGARGVREVARRRSVHEQPDRLLLG